jgi:type IV pilus assembly protein PilW
MSNSKLNETQAMTRNRSLHGPRLAHGFSLIELMISLTIGLVITVAAMSAYLGATGASKMSDAQSRMNEDAQAALNILSQQLRMAGLNPAQAGRIDAYRHNPVYSPYGTTTFTTSPNTFTLSAFSIRGCDGKFSNIAATAANNLDALTCAAGTTSLPDSIAINYEADPYNTVKSGTGVSMVATDCFGNGLSTITATGTATTPTTSGTYWVADNRFYIGTSTAIVSPSLYCKGNGGSTQPMVENIEDMQITYGTVSTATTSTTATVAGYLTANEVVTETNMALLADDATRWGKVLSVRICIIVRSETPAAPDAASAKYYNCANPAVLMNAPDLRLRRAYSTTVVLRNRRY